jgi:hypothetical protein
MNKTILGKSSGIDSAVTTRGGITRGWPMLAPYAAVTWSTIYAALSINWMLSGRGFPYAPETVSTEDLGPLLGQLGPGVAWIVVMMAGIPAAAMGLAMVRGVHGKNLRPIFITAGALLAGVLLLLMTSLTLLTSFGYIPYAVKALITGAEFGKIYLGMLTQWTLVHELLCLLGGFVWLGATVSYARRTGNACLYCGRRDGPEGWTSPSQAAHWGRIAVYVAMVAPLIYAATRFAWALGIPLGMSEEYLRNGQETGLWISGLFLATFGLVGAVLMLGLVQRWGEVFPRWMIGLGGRRVPIALAVVPASIVAVLLLVGGISIWSGYAQLADGAAATGQDLWIVVGPTLLFPVWGAALAMATLGYYYRRRGPCSVCGRGASSETGKPSTSYANG